MFPKKEKGVVRCLDDNGVVYSEHKTDGISIDFIVTLWCIKNGESL